MGHAHVAKSARPARPVIGGTGRGDAAFHADRARVSTGLADIAAEALERGASFVARRKVREPAIREPRDALHGDLFIRAHPERDRPLNRQRVQAGAVDAVPSARVVDDLRRPQKTKDFDLLLDAPRAVAPLHTERLVLDVVPADPGAETDAPA